MKQPKYSEGQMVRLKSYEDLKANEYHFLYSDENLKTAAGAEVAIYKVKNDLRTIVWYEVGQWGHNSIEIPESYIECDASPEKIAASIESESKKSKNFQEFSNQMRAAICNEEYTYRNVKTLLEECLHILDSKMRKQFHLDKDKDLKKELLAIIDIDNISVRRFLSVPEINIGRFNEKKFPIESTVDFEEVLTWITRKLDLFSTRWYSGKLRSDSLKSCSKEMKSSFECVKRSLNHYGEKDYFHNSDLVELSMFAIQTIIYLENPKETDKEKLTEAFHSVTRRMADLYQRKNKDYGNSFAISMDTDGLLVAKIRIGDKVNRYCTLVENNSEAQVTDESLIDTLIDMANYCVMTVVWLEAQEDRNPE